MAKIDKIDVGLRSQIQEVHEETVEFSTSSVSTSNSTSQVPATSSVTFDSMSALNSLTVDLYNALHGKTEAEKLNLDLHDQLSKCHKKIKELTIFEENLRDQVSVN